MAEEAGIGGKTQLATGLAFDPSIAVGGGIAAKVGVGAVTMGGAKQVVKEAAQQAAAGRALAGQRAMPSIARTAPSDQQFLREGVDPSWSTRALRSLDQLKSSHFRSSYEP